MESGVEDRLRVAEAVLPPAFHRGELGLDDPVLQASGRVAERFPNSRERLRRAVPASTARRAGRPGCLRRRAAPPAGSRPAPSRCTARWSGSRDRCRRARRSAASEASSSPQNRQATTRPAKRCGSAAPVPDPLEQAQHRLGRPALLLDLEIGVEVVREREVGVDLQRAAERLLGQRDALGLALRAVLRQHPIHPAQPSPGRRVVRDPPRGSCR